MTHVHPPVIKSNAEILARAKEIHPVQFSVRLLLTILAGVFTGLGWVGGRSWFTIVFLVLWVASHVAWLAKCTQYGYAKGAKLNILPEKE